MTDEKKWSNFLDMIMEGKPAMKPRKKKLTPNQEFGFALLQLSKKFPPIDPTNNATT